MLAALARSCSDFFHLHFWYGRLSLALWHALCVLGLPNEYSSTSSQAQTQADVKGETVLVRTTGTMRLQLGNEWYDDGCAHDRRSREHAVKHTTEHRAAKGSAADATEQHVGAQATHDSDPAPRRDACVYSRVI